jgi:predicted transcriptional regulator
MKWNDDAGAISGDELLALLAALGSAPRLRIVAALVPHRQYVSQLAREIGISRPLLHMHLQRLEAAGLVTSSLELSGDGKAMKYFEIAPFTLRLTPRMIADAARTLEPERHPATTSEGGAPQETPEENT